MKKVKVVNYPVRSYTDKEIAEFIELDKRESKNFGKRGKFIVIEGLDGSGLSTQADLLRNFLRGRGVKTYLTKEPTSNVIGGLVRGALSKIYSLPPAALQLLFAADRQHHLDREIRPMLKNGAIVICDRYFWSSVAYGSLKLDREWLLEINKQALTPDLTIILQVPPKICIQRIVEDRFDLELYEKLEELLKIWGTYQWLAKRFKGKIVVVNGEGSKEEVMERIVKTVKKKIFSKQNNLPV